jgi:hypothetical protein
MTKNSFPIEKIFDGIGFEVKSNFIVKGGEDIDIGCGNEFGGTEEDNEGVDDQKVKILDVVDAFKYNVNIPYIALYICLCLNVYIYVCYVYIYIYIFMHLYVCMYLSVNVFKFFFLLMYICEYVY